MKNKYFILFLYFTLFSFSYAGFQTRTQVIMGTFVSISLPPNQSHYISKIFSKLQEIEKSLSSYDKEASLSKLNQNHHIKYDKILAQALLLSQGFYRETRGYFDISIGSISKKLYHFGEENASIPSHHALISAPLNIYGIKINDKEIGTEKNITLDLGGMGKGYGVDIAGAYLKSEHIHQGIIALSGDIRCLNLCEIYLQSPFEENNFAKIITRIPNLSISTSGTYRRFVKSQKNHHLINPKTASQGKSFVSVSLFSRGSNAKLDAFATAISVMPKVKALEFLQKYQDIGFVLVEKNGNIIKGNLDKLLKIDFIERPKP